MIQSVSLLTAVTVDYIPQTIITLKSARRYCTFHSFHIFVADAISETIENLREALGEDASWLHLFGPKDLLEAERVIYLKCFRYYNKFEISNLAKYVGISHVLRDPSAGDMCVFIDSDIFFFGDVCPLLIEAIDDRAVYLTPQLLEPSNSDLEHDVMTHGWINAGFLCFSRYHAGTAFLLEWLIDRIFCRGHLAPQLGLSCDQTWVSALPILFRDLVNVSTYTGLNVAYWNLDKRPLTRSASDEILAGGDPLLMFHFSGFDETNPNQLSKHVDFPVSPDSILDELCQTYRTELEASKILRGRIQGFKTMPCSSANLASRIQVCAKENDVDIYKTMVRPEIFSRLGSRVDAAFRKTINLIRRR